MHPGWVSIKPVSKVLDSCVSLSMSLAMFCIQFSFWHAGKITVQGENVSVVQYVDNFPEVLVIACLLETHLWPNGI